MYKIDIAARARKAAAFFRSPLHRWWWWEGLADDGRNGGSIEVIEAQYSLFVA